MISNLIKNSFALFCAMTGVAALVASQLIPPSPPLWFCMPIAAAGASIAGVFVLLELKAGGRSLSPLSCLVLMMAVWYFSPALLYTFSRNNVNDFLIFSEHYLVRGFLITLSVFSFFIVGALYARKPERDASEQSLNDVALLACFLGCLFLGGLAYAYRPSLLLTDLGDFLETYSDTAANAEANTFSSIVVVWAILLSLLVREVVHFRKGLWLLTCALPGLWTLGIATAGTGRRQSIFFALWIVGYPLILYYRKQLRVPLLVLAVSGTVMFATVQIWRGDSQAKKYVQQNYGDYAWVPLINFANTSSFHARNVYFYENRPPLLGRSYLVNPLLIVPFASKLTTIEQESYNQAPVLATVEFSARKTFGMGGSYVSELYANFGLLALFPAALLGFSVAWCMRTLSSRSGRILHFLIGCTFSLCLAWYTRSSFFSVLGITRFLIIAWILGLILQRFSVERLALPSTENPAQAHRAPIRRTGRA